MSEAAARLREAGGGGEAREQTKKWNSNGRERRVRKREIEGLENAVITPKATQRGDTVWA